MYYVRRFIGYCIDWFFVVVIGFLSFIANPNFRLEYLIKPSAKMLSPIGFILGIVAFIVLPIFKDCVLGSTSIGKFIVGLKVVNAKTNQRPAFGQLILRNLTFYIPFADMITVLVTKNQKLGDIIAGTKVVNKKEAKHNV